MDNGIDRKPKARAPSARATRRKAALGMTVESQQQPMNDDLEEQDDNELTIRVKDRSSDDVLSAKRNRIGSLFKETPIKNLLKDGAAESLKRPLTGIFRRPGSRAGRKKDGEEESSSQPMQGNFIGGDRSASPVPLVPTPGPKMDFEAVAHAPHVSSSQLHGMLQVDQLAIKHPQLAKLDELDISLLSRFLCLEDEIADDNVPWSWDYLFASVSTEMREEWAHEGVNE